MMALSDPMDMWGSQRACDAPYEEDHLPTSKHSQHSMFVGWGLGCKPL